MTLSQDTLMVRTFNALSNSEEDEAKLALFSILVNLLSMKGDFTWVY